MKNIGRKKTKGFNPAVIAGKDFITVPEFMEYIGYSPTNRASFSRLRSRGEIPSYFRLGGTIYFKVDRVIQFYTKMQPRASKTVLRASLLGS